MTDSAVPLCSVHHAFKQSARMAACHGCAAMTVLLYSNKGHCSEGQTLLKGLSLLLYASGRLRFLRQVSNNALNLMCF